MKNHLRSLQKYPELAQAAPEMLHDLTEPLVEPIRQHSAAQTQRARAWDMGHAPQAGPLLHFQNPSVGITHAGATEISRLDSSPTSDFVSSAATHNIRHEKAAATQCSSN